MVSDGSGGAIVVWFDARAPSAYDIFAQRIDSSGAVQWTSNGVPICSAAGSQISQKVIPDGSGGAIIVWMDDRGGTKDIYAQRVNGAGTTQWTAGGVPLCTATGDQTNPQIAPDGSGGAVMTWLDGRAGATTASTCSGSTIWERRSGRPTELLSAQSPTFNLIRGSLPTGPGARSSLGMTPAAERGTLSMRSG